MAGGLQIALVPVATPASHGLEHAEFRPPVTRSNRSVRLHAWRRAASYRALRSPSRLCRAKSARCPHSFSMKSML
jgi:hypothetical protein